MSEEQTRPWIADTYESWNENVPQIGDAVALKEEAILSGGLEHNKVYMLVNCTATSKSNNATLLCLDTKKKFPRVPYEHLKLVNKTSVRPLKPEYLRVNKVINEKLWLAGVGARRAKIMFVAPNVLDEECATEVEAGWGTKIARNPRMMDSSFGQLLKKLALKEGIDMEKCFYTSIIKYLPDDLKLRKKPTVSMLDEGMLFVEKEIEAIKPDIIVCLGKVAFDSFVDLKTRESDVFGAWFFNKKYNAKIYMIPHITLASKPDKHERFSMDFKAIRRMLDETEGIVVEKIPIKPHVIKNSSELKELVQRLEADNATILSVDCEWHGNQHVDGKLRSLQIAWNEQDAAYIRFMDDQLNYTFDISYEEAGKILAEWCDRDEVHYVGHHISADFMWMSHWLKLKWHKKAIFDSEFALQCVDEANDLGLDAVALKYTDLGKYDWDLIAWKKKNSDKCKDGYGYIPDDILIPYALADVITVIRAYPQIWKQMERQDLVDYYRDILNPFVTDVFTFFGLQGLPIDRQKIDEMRELYNWAKGELEKDFKALMADESVKLMADVIRIYSGEHAETIVKGLEELLKQGKVEDARTRLKAVIGPLTASIQDEPTPTGCSGWNRVEAAFEHMIIAPAFNIRSKPQMQSWLFDVKGYMPVKTTANKDAGMPSISWEKVATYPKEEQRKYTPASDKQTLEILAAVNQDKTLDALLELNAVGNICKAFLKPAEEDADGNLVKEQGLHYWITSEDTISLQHSTTETGRPRSLILNELRIFTCVNLASSDRNIRNK